MFYRTGLALLYIIGVGLGATAHENGRTVSKELFSSLEELSRLVDIAYCVSTTGVQEPFQCLSHCAEFPEMELITTWNTGILLSDSCGYIAVSHEAGAERIILAFRGTYSITNTIIDLSAIPQAYVPYTGDEEEEPQGNSQTKCENCTVHAGFLKSWINTRSTILPVLSETKLKYPNYSISLVGHSLGGAVAALAGLEMKLKGMEPTVTTFGEPMIGNEEFAKFLDKNFQLDEHSPNTHSFRRVTHINDPVPLLPLQEWGYAPHAGEIFISKPDLSPNISDIQFCTGDKDSSCISGSEKPKVLPWLSRDGQFSLSSAEKKPCSSGDVGQFGSEGSEFVKQENCGTVSEETETETTWSSSRSSNQKQSPLRARWDWSLIPARYHLWELFHAHRDYFWRIGLCVPGGDPTGFATDW
ncbi:hypothetical protein N7540_006321 [Penicillium herquei]|nr:hypothetical protein N7540_006321 [Penicillium herquei]